MDKVINITDDKIKFAIDAAVTLTIEEIVERTGESSSKVLAEFIDSKTGALLYDGSSKLWCNGPAYIAEMYLKEKSE